MGDNYGFYTAAFVSKIPESFRDKSLRLKKDVAVHMDGCRKEQAEFISIIKKELKLVEVSEIVAEEENPDCVFVDDAAIVVNNGLSNVAFMCKPNSIARQKTVDTVKRQLQAQYRLTIIEIKDEQARIDGGDILYTGNEFFVGLSQYTNQAGALALANAFPDTCVTSISLPSDVFHLKDKVSAVDKSILIVGNSESAQYILKQIVVKANYDYYTVTLPDDAAANILYINNHVIHCSRDDYPDSVKILEERLANYTRIAVPCREFMKLGSALTSRIMPFIAGEKLRHK